MKLYPAIDLLDGQAVRLTKGDFNAVTVYGDDAVAIAKTYSDTGSRYLHIVDLSGAKDGIVKQRELIKKILASTQLEAQVGGGVRSIEQVKAYLDSGAKRVVIGSLAVKDAQTVQKIVSSVGPDKITIAVDFFRDSSARAVVALHGWKEVSDVSVGEVIEKYYKLGILNFLCTDVSRDGTLCGPQVEFYIDLQQRFPDAEIQVSGGIGKLEDLRKLKSLGAKAAILGKSLYEGAFTLAEALQC